MSELAALEAAGGAGTPVVLGGDPTAHPTAPAPQPDVDPNRGAGAKASDRPEGLYQLIPIFLIQPARDNVRRDRGQLGELTASIKRKGVLEPLLVDARGDHFRIIAGERRWAAAKLAGLTAVPCIVRKGVDDYERLEDMLVENLQRRDLQPIEEAQAFDRMQTELGYSQRDIAQAIGKSQSYVSKRLLLLTLPAKVRREVAAGKLPMNEALGYQSAGTGRPLRRRRGTCSVPGSSSARTRSTPPTGCCCSCWGDSPRPSRSTRRPSRPRPASARGGALRVVIGRRARAC
jgi:ParB/RepB/Spo0J family partition protein